MPTLMAILVQKASGQAYPLANHAHVEFCVSHLLEVAGKIDSVKELVRSPPTMASIADMTYRELQAACKTAKLPAVGKKNVLSARLTEYVMSRPSGLTADQFEAACAIADETTKEMMYRETQSVCKARQLPTVGTVDELRTRLASPADSTDSACSSTAAIKYASRVRKAPMTHAGGKDPLPEGSLAIGEDGHMYMVAVDKNGRHFWKKRRDIK